MFCVDKRNLRNAEIANTIKELTKDFIDYSINTLSVQYPKEFRLIDTSTRRIRDVFRHSLCLALDLRSKPAFEDVDAVYPIYEQRMRKFVDKYADKSTAYRMGILQLGVNCMVKVTTKRGDEGE